MSPGRTAALIATYRRGMLRVIAVAALLAAMTPGVARGASWRWPVRGRVAGTLLLSPGDPYAAGQRRGIVIAAQSGATVDSACAGRVAFAGSVGRAGPTVSVACGALRATYQGLRRLLVRRGDQLVTGAPLGVLGTAGLLRLGARVQEARRSGPPRYLDPLRLLAREPPRVPPVGVAPRAAPRRRDRPGHPEGPVPLPAPSAAPVPAAAPSRPAPLGAWIGLALLGIALPAGSWWHLRLVRGGRGSRPAAAAVADDMRL